MLEPLIQSQFDLYYNNIFRHITIQKINAIQNNANNNLYYSKYIYQQNNFYITANNINTSFTIIIPPYTKIADTYTPGFIQEFIFNQNILVANAIFYNEYGNSLTQSYTFSATINSNTIILPVLTQYTELYNMDATIYDKAMLLKMKYNYDNITLTLLIDKLNLENITNYDYYDIALIPNTYSGAINFYYISSFDLLYSINNWSFTFYNNATLVNTKNYEVINKLSGSNLPYISTTLSNSQIFVLSNFNTNYRFIDNILELDINCSSPVTITKTDTYNIFLVAYKNMQVNIVNNSYIAELEYNVNKFIYNGIQPNPFVPIYIYKQSILSTY